VTRANRRASAVLTATLLALLPLAATLGPSPAAAIDTAPPPLVITLSTLRPVAPQPGQTLVLTGSIRNATPDPVSNVNVGLRMAGTAIGTRGEFDQYADNPTEDVTSFLPPVGTPVSVASGARLLPDATQPFRITIPVDSLELPTTSTTSTTWQVRELAMVATATNATEGTDTGTLRTFLPWAPRTVSSTPVQVAWVWPLVDRPHRAVGAAWLDDDLAGELGSGGRLAQLVQAASAAEHPPSHPVGRHHRKVTPPGVPVTWALDPMLVEDATLMSKGYTVKGTNGHTTTGAGHAAASQWLTDLHSGVDGAEVIPLPYADTDLVAAVRANLGSEASVATANGRDLLTRALPSSELLRTAWPLDGLADQQTVDTLPSMGITSVLLSSDALPIIGGPPPETPSAHTTVPTGNGPLQAILADSGLTGTVEHGATTPGDSSLDLQRFLAETLMIQAEGPNDHRSLVVAPDQRWQPASGYADALLADSGRVPWIDPVSLSTVLGSPLYTKVTRNPLDYPASQRQTELRPQYLRQVRALKNRLVGFGTVLTAGTSTVLGYDSALQRLLSSGYRGDAAGRQRVLTAIHDDLQSQMNKVHIVTRSRSFITLTSHNGQVPITVANDLNTPVHIVLKVNANQRLAFANDGRTLLTIPANTQFPVNVRAVAKTSGVFPLEVRLLTPDKRPYGATVQIFVRSTAYGTITLVITAAATLALLIAVAIRLTRRAVSARRTARAGA
jgi:hypothetical protein